MDFNSNDRKIKDKERMSRVKKKIIALFLASLMVASSIPVPMVQAEVTAEETDSSTEGTFPADGEDIPPENENKEDEAIVQANTIMGQIDALMEAPLSREKYEAVKAAYDSASEDVIAYFDIEKANCFNQLHELMDSADKAVDAIDSGTQAECKRDRLYSVRSGSGGRKSEGRSLLQQIFHVKAECQICRLSSERHP